MTADKPKSDNSLFCIAFICLGYLESLSLWLKAFLLAVHSR